MTTSNIASAINAAHAGVEGAKQEGARCAIECGRLLVEAKATVAHGGWDTWIRTHCAFSPRSARLYMKVFRYVGSDSAKRQRVADMSFREIAKMVEPTEAASAIAPAACDPAEDDPITDAHRVVLVFVRFGGVAGMMRLLRAFELGCSPKTIGKALRTTIADHPKHSVEQWEPILGMFERAKTADVKKVIYASFEEVA